VFLSVVVFNVGTLPMLLPVLWTWGLSQNTVGDAFTAAQLALGGWKDVYFAFPWLALASFFVTGIIVGKSLCGWVCPFGFVQDLVGFVKRKKTEFTPRTHKSTLYLKYIILATALFISLTFAASKMAASSDSYQRALGIFTTAPFTVLSPSETLFATLPRMVGNAAAGPIQDALSVFANAPALFWVQFALLVGILIFTVYVPRGWCRYICPHGAVMAIMNKFSFIGLRREPFKCEKGGCRDCVEACPMRVPILDLPWEKFSHEECIYCMKCADACPNKAIKPTYP
jgi:polyferredoxin